MSRFNFRLAKVLTLLAIPLFAKGQEWDSVKYQTGFKFNKGFYLTAEQARRNAPIAVARIIYSGDKNDTSFFRKITGEKAISYVSSKGDTITVKTTHYWGYSDGDSIYYFTSNNNKLSFFGKRVYRPTAPVSLYEVGEVSLFRIYRNTLGVNQTVVPTMVDYMLDLKTGEAVLLTNYSIDSVLSKDKSLFKEYKKDELPKKEKNLVYLLKYNQQHPIYFRKED